MKHILHFLGTLSYLAFISLALSAFFSFCKWLLSLASVCGTPTWGNFWGGALALFAFFFLRSCFDVIRSLYKSKKHSYYKKAYEAGIPWSEYNYCRKRYPFCNKGDVYKIYDKHNDTWHKTKIISDCVDDSFEILIDNVMCRTITRDEFLDYYMDTYNTSIKQLARIKD